MTGERLELVTDFAALEVGMIIVAKPCPRCGGSHRAMLLRFEPDWLGTIAGGGLMRGPGWKISPGPACVGGGPAALLSPKAVAERRIFRVVDGLEQGDATATRAPAPRKRMEPAR